MPLDFERLARNRGLSVQQIEVLRNARGLTAAGIERIPEPAIRRAVRRLDYPDAPRARLSYRLEQSRDDAGRIPSQPLVPALRQLDAMRLRGRRTRVAGVPTGTNVRPAALAVTPPPAAGLVRRDWVALGPGNIGGRTRAIVIHPTNHNTMWAGSVGGGIWRTDDGGASWVPVDDFMANLAVTSLVLDPTNPNVMYAGTGEGFGNLDAIRGGGIFRTRDGVAWSQIPATYGAAWNAINRLAISADGMTVLAATNHGLQRSSDAARAIWQTVLPDIVADVKFHPIDPQRAVAGSVSSGQAWFSSDGGATWTVAGHGVPWGRRVELCFAAASRDLVYASVDTNGGEIWRSTDGGRTFARRRSANADGDTANYLGDQGWYGNCIWAGDPTNADLVVVGGVDLWRSTDGGDTLTDISTWWDPASAHADQHTIVAHPAYDGRTNRTVFFGNDGGLFRATDVTSVGNDTQPPRVTGWTALNNSYGVTQFYSAAGNATSGVIVGGAQDNGTLAYDPASGSNNWKTIFGGDGGFCCADASNPRIFYGQYVYLDLHRNTDGATTNETAGDRYISGHYWNTATNRWDWKPAPFQIPDAFNQRALFIAPFTLDPNNSNRILAGGESLWCSTDVQTPNTPTSGPRWSRIKPPSNSLISAVAITPGDSDRVWVGHIDGEIWRSQNATQPTPTWSRVDALGARPLVARRFCNQILVSPHDPATVLVVYGGFTAGNVWSTDDGGTTWTNVAAGLPAAPVRAVAIHPKRPDWFYIGTEVGVFTTEDRGQTWSATNEGPASVSVDDLFWMDQRLVCVTHGRGLFAIDLSPVAPSAPPGRSTRATAGPERASQLQVERLSVVAADAAGRIKAAARLDVAMRPMPPDQAAPVEPRPPAPGKERWSIKTGTDSDASKVGTYDFEGIGAAGIVDTTVDELVALPRPNDMLPVEQNQPQYQSMRARPVEYVIWRVKADITVIKREADGDLHIVLQGDGGETMVAEAPTPRPPFVGEESPWLDAMGEVRRKIEDKFGPEFAGVPFTQMGKYLVPTTAVGPGVSVPAAVVPGPGMNIFDMTLPFKAKVPPTPVEVVGVGFFDRVHGQTGVATTNGIELHPILSIDWR